MFGHKYRYVFVLLLGVYSYLNIIFTEGDRLFGYELSSAIFISILVVMVLLIWEANRGLEIVVARLQSLFDKKVHYLIIHFGLSLLVVLCISLGVVAIFSQIPGETFAYDWLHLKLSMGFAFRVNLFLHCINAIIYFIEKARKNQLEAEMLKKENTEARFQALRNQINPHFLFNSFNVLSTLVYKDPELSARFIEQLSSVYRYLLSNQDKKLVTLREELDFINSYTFLLKIRFGENFQLKKEIEEDKLDQHLAPASLQMVIENAIKHNAFTRKNPLNIQVFSENGYLNITNNLQEKEIKETGTHLGLKNITSRYRFLSEKQVEVIKSETTFTVRIPLIKISSI